MTILARLLTVLLILKPVRPQNNTAYRVFHDIVTDFTKAFYFHGARMNVTF
jgi:hypothetical protein